MKRASKRDQRFNMVMSATERMLLATLAAENGISESDVVRQLIRKAFRAHEKEKK